MKGRGTRTLILLFGVVFGAPLLSLAAHGDENWDSNFGVPGANGIVGPMVVFGHRLFAGGDFTQIGGVETAHIAQWDGTNWSPLGLGVDGVVGAIVASGSDLLVAGGFNSAGGVSASHIAKWDGTNWSALSTGLDGYAYALAVAGNKLFAGGNFSSAGGVAATNIAMWDGSSWTNLADGVNGAVSTLAADGTNLYVGGSFSQAGSVAAKYVAKWDGNEWSAMGVNAWTTNGGIAFLPPAAIRLKGNEVYMLTNEAHGPWRPAAILRWDGTNWTSVATLVPYASTQEYTDYPADMLILGGDFYICGIFCVCGPDVGSRDIGKYDGSNWSSFGSGMDLSPTNYFQTFRLASTGSELFMSGVFASVGGGIPSTNIALWHIPHALSASRSENALTLSWPATGTNFVLESTHSLGQSDWAEVLQTPIVIGNKLTVTNELLSNQKFYRLRRR